MPSALENMADYITLAFCLDQKRFTSSTCETFGDQESTHKLCALAHHSSTLDAVSAADELILQRDYAQGAGFHVFLRDCYIDDFQKPHLIRFSRRYTIGSENTRTGTPFREGNILQLRNNNSGFLHVHQSTSFCKITYQTFEDPSNTVGHYVAFYEAVVVGKGAPEHPDMHLGRRKNKTTIYISVLLLGYCRKTALSLVHISYIEHSRYVHQNELMSSRIGDVIPAVHRGNDCNSFSGGFVTITFFVNTNNVPHMYILTASIAKSFGNNKVPFRRLLQASYDDEQRESKSKTGGLEHAIHECK